MTEPKIDESIIHTQDVLLRFIEKRDALLKLIEKDLVKLSQKQVSGTQHLTDNEKSLLSESDKILRTLTKFDADCILKSLYNFEKEYKEILCRDVHPKFMQREMVDFLIASSDEFLNESKLFAKLHDETMKFYEYLKSVSDVETECSKAAKDLMPSAALCQNQLQENASLLRRLEDYFSVPPECPPHL